MTSGIYFPVCCLFFNILIMWIYFSKKRLKNIENNLYKILLISNFIGLIIEILCYFGIRNVDNYPIICSFILRSYLFYLCFFIAVFTDYNSVITYKSRYEAKDIHNFFNIILVITIFLIVLEIPFIFFLPMNIFNDNNIVAYTYGAAVNFVYFVAGISMCIWFFNMIINFKNLKNKKYLPMFIFLVIGTIATLVQFKYPSILLMTSMETLIISLMFHTIENPDLQMISQLELAKSQAEKANRAKSDFLSSMSHEIRTPLNAIVGLSEDMESRDTCPEDMKSDLSDVVSASKTLLEIVGNIMDISKIESDKMEIIEIPYNFKEEIETLARVNSVKIGDKPIELKLSFAEDLPYELFGDKGHIKEVVNNLLSNSIKYTDQGTILLTTKCINRDNVCNLIISCSDTGRGIKSENICKLFTKFERLDVEKNTTTEGTGLGLAITKKLVELMGGKINVQSQYGKGSIFVVQLPQKISKQSMPLSETELINTLEIKQKLESSNTNYSDKSILVVDDNKLNIKVARRSIESFNFKVVDECYNGQECLDLINSGNKYDIILMDIMMPIMSGETAIKELKKIPGFNTPIIALTADAVAGAEEKYKSEGFINYLAKPFNKDQLKIKLDDIINSENKSVVIDKWKDIPKVVICGEKDDELMQINDNNLLNVNYLKSNNIDVDHGIELLGDMDMYNETITMFYDELKGRISKLKQFKEEADMPNYAVEVHALKSDCKYIGALALADLAYSHELKSKDNDINFVNNNFEELMIKTEEVSNVVKNYLGK